MVNITAFYCGNLALESFIMISVFFTTYKSLQIMNAKDSILTVGDVLKILTRKFLRLAPVYYTMWAIIWAITSRMIQGPRSYMGNINMATCDTDWKYTMLMVGNL
jgi:peptidoglycan/LPS O-acetylase OafA/YrhL